MKKSLTFRITLFIIKLKGLKKEFSKDPIDFKKIRKEDVYQPRGRFFKQNNIRKFEVSNSSITEIGPQQNATKLLIFIHGGAYISGPAQHHWDTVKEISKQTQHTVWVCNYPKAPENTISKISDNIDAIYSAALETYQPNQISCIGDSVGGTLTTALIQRLITKSIELLPSKIMLISPVMDASMTNSDIEKIEITDPMLSTTGVLSAKKMCAGDTNLKDPKISPLYGSFKNFPRTILFAADNDITYPDQMLAVQKLMKAQVNIELIEGKGMPHIWPFLPIMKEAKLSLKQIIDKLNHK